MLCTREVTVQVPDGLHHQTAARFIQTANRFTSVVRVVYGDNNVNAKKPTGCALPVHRSGGADHDHRSTERMPERRWMRWSSALPGREPLEQT